MIIGLNIYLKYFIYSLVILMNFFYIFDMDLYVRIEMFYKGCLKC